MRCTGRSATRLSKIRRLHQDYLQPNQSNWYLSKPHSSSHPGSLPWNP